MSNESWKMDGEEDVQMPLGTGGDSSGEVGFGETKKPTISSSTMMLAGVFAAGLLLVFVLGKQAGPRTADAAQQSRDEQLRAALTEMMSKAGGKSGAKDTEALVKLFKGEIPPLDPDTVKAENPFERKLSRKDEPIKVNLPVITDAGEAAKYRKVAETYASLKLQSIMSSKNRSAAMINNRIVSVGTTFGDLVVTDIEPERVVLSFGERKFELKLARPGGGE